MSDLVLTPALRIKLMHISLDDPVCIHQHNIKRSTGDSIKVAMANQSAREFLESSKGATSISVLFIFVFIYYAHF